MNVTNHVSQTTKETGNTHNDSEVESEVLHQESNPERYRIPKHYEKIAFLPTALNRDPRLDQVKSELLSSHSTELLRDQRRRRSRTYD